MPSKRPRRHSKDAKDLPPTSQEYQENENEIGHDKEHDQNRDYEHTASETQNPFMQMFSNFRDEIDEHHDRRERVIKASRDITASSKKLYEIFTLQRIRSLDTPLPAYVTREYQTRLDQINDLLSEISSDLQGINAHRYQRNLSAGIQEFMEAISFHHYITTAISSKADAKTISQEQQQGRLITISEAQKFIPKGIQLTIGDYMGGIFDLVGEVMKLAITIIATSPATPSEEPGKTISRSSMMVPPVLADLREMRCFFESLDTVRGNGELGKEVEKKLVTMKICVEKVERAVYGMVVRGREKPAGWLPEVEVGNGGGRNVEDY